MTAGIETLKRLSGEAPYRQLEARGSELQEGLAAAACRAGIPVTITRAGSLLTMFFTDRPVTDYDSAKASDAALFARFFTGLLKRGVYWPPSQFEAAFISLAHLKGDIKTTLKAAEQALNGL